MPTARRHIESEAVINVGADRQLIFSKYHSVLGQNIGGWHVYNVNTHMTETFTPYAHLDAARAHAERAN